MLCLHFLHLSVINLYCNFYFIAIHSLFIALYIFFFLYLKIFNKESKMIIRFLESLIFENAIDPTRNRREEEIMRASNLRKSSMLRNLKG